MFHKEIHAKISELLRQRPDHGQYRLLDLGCGNARFLAPTLMNCLPGHSFCSRWIMPGSVATIRQDAGEFRQ